MFGIDDKDINKFKSYVIKALQFFKGDSIPGENLFEFEIVAYILQDIIKPKEEINYFMFRDLIRTVLFDMNREGLDCEVFLEHLNKIYQDRMSKPLSDFFFIASLNTDYRDFSTKEFVVDKTKVEILNFQQIEEKFNLSKHFTTMNLIYKEEKKLMEKFSYALIKVRERDNRSAFHKAYHIFELFRAVLNLTQVYGKSLYHYGERPRPLSKVQPSKRYILFDHNKNYVDYWHPSIPFEYRIQNLDNERLKFALKLFDEINSLVQCPLKDRLLSSFIRYNEGLDGNITGTSFISFWQILEFIALADKSNMSEKEVSKRIGKIVKAYFWQDLLSALRNRRNHLVHKGVISEFDAEESNIIKWCCEVAILFLLGVVNDFRDEPSLDFFYKNVDLPIADLKRGKKVLSYIEKLRSSGSKKV